MGVEERNEYCGHLVKTASLKLLSSDAAAMDTAATAAIAARSDLDLPRAYC